MQSHLDLPGLADDTGQTEELLHKRLQLLHGQLGPCPATVWAHSAVQTGIIKYQVRGKMMILGFSHSDRNQLSRSPRSYQNHFTT